MDLDLNKFISGFLHAEIKKLYLGFLYSLEDLRDQNAITEDQFNRMRKRVLDGGNNCYRNIQEQLDNLDIKLSNLNN